MKVEQPCTDLAAARKNREHIEKMRKHEGGPRYRFAEIKEVRPTARPFKRGIRG